MIGHTSQGYEEPFLDAQDITDYPVFNSSKAHAQNNAKKYKKDNIVKEELRLLRGIKNAVSAKKTSHDRRQEKKFDQKKDKTQQRILEDLDELLKYIKKNVINGGGKRSIFNSLLPEKRDRNSKYAGGLFSKKARKEAAEIAEEKGREPKDSLLKRFAKGGKLLKYGGIAGLGLAGVGLAGKNIYDNFVNPTKAKSERGIGRILKSASAGALSGGEIGGIFDGIGAIPGALIGGIGAGGIEAYSEYKDDITKGFSNFSKTVAKKAASETDYVLNATSKEISKFTDGRVSFDMNFDDLEKTIIDYKDKIEDTLIGFWKKGIDALENNTFIPKIGTDIKQGAYRAFDKAENKVGIHAAWEPSTVSAINDITKGPNAVNRDYAIAVAQLESGGGQHIGNSTSSAKGMYQVLDGTRKELAKKYNIDISNPFDPETNAKLFKAYTEENTPILNKALGRESTDPEKYMSYVFGAGDSGAPALIKSAQNSPDTIAASIMAKAAASNKGIFYDKHGKARTTKQVYDEIVSRYNSALKKGLAGMATQESRFGMDAQGNKKDLTKDAEAAAKPATDAIKRAVTDVMDSATRAKDALINYYDKTIKKDTDEVDLTVKGKTHNLNLKPTWLQKNMPATANNWDSLKGYGRSLNAFFSGNALGTTDLSGGDRTFVNRSQYQRALDSNVSWLEKGNLDAGNVTRAPIDNNDNLGFGPDSENQSVKESRKNIREQAAQIQKSNNQNTYKKVETMDSAQDLNSTKIDLDDMPMFLQDSGVIIVNSGRAT